MRLVFAGTPEFAATALAALHDAGFAIPLVLTQPDRPAGRGMQLQPSPVKQYALAHAPAYQHPRFVWFVERLPLSSTNKVDRTALKREAEARIAAQVG